MRLYVAGVVGTGLTFLCHLLEHPSACWLMRTRLYRWAEDVTGFDHNHPPICGTMPPYATTGAPLRCNQPPGHPGAHGIVGSGTFTGWLTP